MTNDQIDALLEPILNGAGTSLRHYSMQKSKDDMRSAMRAATATAVEGAIEWIRNNYQDHNIASLCDGLRAHLSGGAK